MRELTTTSNRTLYNRLYKRELEHTGKIRCGWCKYHRNENATYRPRKSWKDTRDRQYLTVGK